MFLFVVLLRCWEMVVHCAQWKTADINIIFRKHQSYPSVTSQYFSSPLLHYVTMLRTPPHPPRSVTSFMDDPKHTLKFTNFNAKFKKMFWGNDHRPHSGRGHSPFPKFHRKAPTVKPPAWRLALCVRVNSVNCWCPCAINRRPSASLWLRREQGNSKRKTLTACQVRTVAGFHTSFTTACCSSWTNKWCDGDSQVTAVY